MLSLQVFLARIVNELTSSAVPWGWYTARVTGIVAFLMLYITIFLGLSIRIPILKKFFSPIFALDLHIWFSFQALLLALAHGLALLFDQTIIFTLKDIFVPLASSYEPNLIALGIIGFYLMLLLITTSHIRKILPYKLWRATHSINAGLYVIVFVHALYLGTDLQIGILRSIFVWANVLLAMLFVYNIYFRLSSKNS